MRIFIDIETAPTTDPVVIAEIRASIKPPANYSKPESIQQWMETKGEHAALEAIGKTALSPEDGSIIAIGIAADDDKPPVVFVRDPNSETDAYLLFDVADHIEQILIQGTTYSSTEPGRPVHVPSPWWIGHNVVNFDLPFIWKRCVINEINLNITLPPPDELRHNKNCYDTMQAWAGYRGMISLSRLSRVLGIPDPKQNQDGITGANAWEYWQRGDLETVKKYCAADVTATRAIYHRMQAMTWRAA